MARISFSGQELPVGLDIGQNQIRAVQLKRDKGELVLHEFGSIALPEGATHEGEVVNPELVSQALQTLWRDHRFTGKIVATGVANQQIIFRMIDFPWTEEKRLREAVMLQVQDYIPIPIDEAIIDFAVMGEKVNEDGDRLFELMLAAIDKKIIGSIVEAVEGAKLKLARIDLTPLALVRSVLGDHKRTKTVQPESFFSQEGTVAVLHVASGVSNLAIVENGTPRFVRFIPHGGNNLTQKLSREFDISFEEAEKIKRDLGLPALDGSIPPLMGYTPDVVFKAQSILEREVSHYINELRLSFEFYQSQSATSEDITKIYATGSGMRLNNFSSYLEASLKADVEIVDPFGSIRISDALQKYLGDERYSFAPAIGLAIGGR